MIRIVDLSDCIQPSYNAVVTTTTHCNYLKMKYPNLHDYTVAIFVITLPPE